MNTLKYLDYIRKKNYVPRIKQKKKKSSQSLLPFRSFSVFARFFIKHVVVPWEERIYFCKENIIRLESSQC